ncbi:hypothetical protein JCM8097_006365 [Rhodosporidiobolus ruineniae]
MKAANWPDCWIKTALELTQEYYMKWYGRSAEEEDETDLVIVEPEEADKFISPAQRILLTAAAASAPPSTSLSDLIERTARTPPQYDHIKGKYVSKDPRAYWEAKLAESGGGGNRLAEFACDLFNCPASSIDVERSFSHGRHLVSEFQHAYTPKRISSLLIIASYWKCGIIKSGLLTMRQREEARAAAKDAALAKQAELAKKRAAEEEAERAAEEGDDDVEERPRTRRRLDFSADPQDADDE